MLATRRHGCLRSKFQFILSTRELTSIDGAADSQDNSERFGFEGTRARLLAGASMRLEVQRRRDRHPRILRSSRTAPLRKRMAYSRGSQLCLDARLKGFGDWLRRGDRWIAIRARGR